MAGEGFLQHPQLLRRRLGQVLGPLEHAGQAAAAIAFAAAVGDAGADLLGDLDDPGAGGHVHRQIDVGEGKL
ncbi:hypothetical protein HC022_18905 [Salipiger sp. HF18]|nr:hypothetical protein [Salipiger sp. HF18]